MNKVILVIFIAFPDQSSAAEMANHFWTGTKGAFSEENKWVWLGGGALTLIAFEYDKDIYLH